VPRLLAMGHIGLSSVIVGTNSLHCNRLTTTTAPGYRRSQLSKLARPDHIIVGHAYSATL